LAAIALLPEEAQGKRARFPLANVMAVLILVAAVMTQ
jgi:hypothetical protein